MIIHKPIGRFIAVVGPSGVGKDSVMEAMAAAEPRMSLVRRVITRPSDAGGEEFEGVSAATFQKMRDDGAFALWWSAHGLFYGIPAEVDAVLAQGHDVLANLSRGMLVQMQNRFQHSAVLALNASRDVLQTRLTVRGREDPAEIARRLVRADFTIPDEIAALKLDNSGPLDVTVNSALALLYPVSA